MSNFAIFFEDFNNWRTPVNANSSTNIINPGTAEAQPNGFKGEQGSMLGNSIVPIKMNKTKKLTRLQKILIKLRE